ESGLTFDADWLKRKRVVEPADQAIGTGADADCRAARNTNISPVQCARPHARGGRKDGPGQCYVVCEPDLRTEASNVTLIILGRSTARGREHAVERARRKDNISCRPRASTAQHAHLNVRMRWHCR